MKLEDGKASSLSELPEELVKVAEKVGLEKDGHRRSGSFMHLDYRSLLATVNELFEGQVELLDIKDALRKYDWLKNYYGRLIPPEKDDYTSLAENNLHGLSTLNQNRFCPQYDLDCPIEQTVKHVYYILKTQNEYPSKRSTEEYCR